MSLGPGSLFRGCKQLWTPPFGLILGTGKQTFKLHYIRLETT